MMKITILQFLFFALAAFIIPQILGDVLDTDGNQVVAGTKYYILPAVRPSNGGGGLTLNSGVKSCLKNVVQSLNEADNGLPVIFYPANSASGSVVSSSDSNIEFSASTKCMSNIWTLKTNFSTSERFVTTGGVKGNPGMQTLRNWFQIQEFDGAYKIVFCPQVCAICRPLCGELGISGVTKHLIVKNDPFKVVFKKV